MFKSRYEVTQISFYFIILRTRSDFTIGVAFRFRGVHSADSGHIDPDLIIRKSGNEDGPRYRNRITLFAGFIDLVSETDDDERPFLELLRRHHVHIILLMVVHDGITEFRNIDTSHAEHECRRLHSAVLVALVTFHACTVSHVCVTGTVNDGFRKNRFTAFLALDYHALHLIALLDYI